ncbi:hypothetical protein [Caproiciproducens sp. CPB-2]|uniref:hypothetical protein n=1 Tax=Caproiciproducens sp. CPB-2 TaxID=3030017 RepID=UPI0023DBBBBE|nr:hypothetical protein [Caproiciproducens sp. CPB-2]MDF1495229.1 hypothetical protein [Caproiciproducens sp. CPB-2]
MAKLSFFIYSEAIQSVPPMQPPKPVITGPLMVLTPIRIPGNYSFAISFGILGFNITQSNKLQIVFSDPNGVSIQDTGVVELPADQGQGNLPPEYQGLVLNMDYRNVLFRNEGDYKTTVFLNGEDIGGSVIPVIASEKQ